MSHLAKLKTSVTDAQALVRALGRMGIDKSRIEVHDKAIQAKGYHQEETFNANVIVRKNGSFGSDIGWEKDGRSGVFAAHLDEYNYSSGQHYSKEWQNRLYTFYNVEKAKMELEAKGIEHEELVDDVGRVQVRARFNVQDRSRFTNVR